MQSPLINFEFLPLSFYFPSLLKFSGWSDLLFLHLFLFPFIVKLLNSWSYPLMSSKNNLKIPTLYSPNPVTTLCSYHILIIFWCSAVFVNHIQIRCMANSSLKLAFYNLFPSSFFALSLHHLQTLCSPAVQLGLIQDYDWMKLNEGGKENHLEAGLH